MARMPAALETLLHELGRLPGVGRRAAGRMAVYLLEAPEEQVGALAHAIGELREHVRPCAVCGNWAQEERCAICENPQRKSAALCVVERPTDLWAFEDAEVWPGRYHVLGGTLSPLAGITAEDLRIGELERRIRQEGIAEVVIATNPSVEGDATARYLAHRLTPQGVRVTRLAQGVPLGGRLGYADAGTLRLALEGRRTLSD